MASHQVVMILLTMVAGSFGQDNGNGDGQDSGNMFGTPQQPATMFAVPQQPAPLFGTPNQPCLLYTSMYNYEYTDCGR